MAGSSLGSRVSTTVMGENNRQMQSGGAQSAHKSNMGSQRGIIIDVSPDGKPLVKVNLFKNGGPTDLPLADGKWIPLDHSSLEIAERWGTIRKNMVVLVSFRGNDGSDASAVITGLENEAPGKEAIASNDAQMEGYRIFAPGIGL